MDVQKKVLHVGCGHYDPNKLPTSFRMPEWAEIRLDVDPSTRPDIVGSMLDMRDVPDESMDAIYSSHNIEHVFPHEVELVMSEFKRVLKPSGFLIITCPDLQEVAKLVAEDRLTDAAYVSPAGPISPLDILYGYRPALAQGNHFMAHKCGFTLKVLIGTLRAAGMQSVLAKKRTRAFDLWAIATKVAVDEVKIRRLGDAYLPK